LKSVYPGCASCTCVASSSPSSGVFQWNAMMHIANTKGSPTIPENISSEARDFLERCWERDPYRRPNCDALLTHPFIMVSKSPPGEVLMPAGRMHPTVGTFPSPIQEEGPAFQQTNGQRATPADSRTPRAHLSRTCPANDILELRTLVNCLFAKLSRAARGPASGRQHCDCSHRAHIAMVVRCASNWVKHTEI
jgi:serine/threonine protein kinase